MSGRMLSPVPLFLALAGCVVAPAVDESWYIQVSRERVVGQSDIPVYGYRVVRRIPHDIDAYTEGLVLRDGVLFEGTGRYGLSVLRRIDPADGRILSETRLDAREFGEGVTVHDGKVHQLTYLSNTGFIRDATTLEPVGTFRYVAQGWGLTTDGERLLQSDGSSSIRSIDPVSHAVLDQVYVEDGQGPVGFLNELEHAEGRLYANVWQTEFIAIIEPATGRLTGWIDLAGLNPDPARLRFPFVLNGIAYDERTGNLIVTGKCWPDYYEIELVERPRPTAS